jgi:broad specificity phosphatase PhoE
MFIPVLESMGKITGATVEMQQEMFKKWFSIWPGMPMVPGIPVIPGIPASPAAWGEQVQKIQKRWAETVSELLRRQQETVETQFKAGQQNIENAFQIGEAKSPEELRARTKELWQKCIEAVRQASEAQMRDFTVAIEKWVDLMTTALPTS